MDYYAVDPVVPKNPIHVLKSGDFKPRPTMVGICRDEGSIYVAGLLKDPLRLNREWKNIGASILYTKGGDALTKEQETNLNIMKK